MTGFEWVFLAVAAIAAVAGTATSIVQAEQAKGAAKKKEELEKRRLAGEQAQRQLEQARERARLRRQARAQQAELINRAGVQNVRFTTPTSAAFNAVRQNLAREFRFIEQTGNLAAVGDQITLETINLESSAAQSRAQAQLFSGVFEGVSQLASIGFKAQQSGLFDGSSNIDETSVGEIVKTK